jgi:hypothetical protein
MDELHVGPVSCCIVEIHQDSSIFGRSPSFSVTLGPQFSIIQWNSFRKCFRYFSQRFVDANFCFKVIRPRFITCCYQIVKQCNAKSVFHHLMENRLGKLICKLTSVSQKITLLSSVELSSGPVLICGPMPERLWKEPLEMQVSKKRIVFLSSSLLRSRSLFCRRRGEDWTKRTCLERERK